jgi:hypothetical protein
LFTKNQLFCVQIFGRSTVVLTSVSPQVLDTQLPGLAGLVERMGQKGSGLDTLLKPGQQSIIQLTHLLSDARNFCATEKYHITHTYESTNGKGILYQALPLAQLVMNFRSYTSAGSRHGNGYNFVQTGSYSKTLQQGSPLASEYTTARLEVDGRKLCELLPDSLPSRCLCPPCGGYPYKYCGEKSGRIPQGSGCSDDGLQLLRSHCRTVHRTA